MSQDSTDGGQPSGFEPPLSAIKARQMGELSRGDDRWEVVLESARDPEVDALRGRIHFASGKDHRWSAWIFLEWSQAEVENRFADFSAQELWNLLDSIR